MPLTLIVSFILIVLSLTTLLFLRRLVKEEHISECLITYKCMLLPRQNLSTENSVSFCFFVSVLFLRFLTKKIWPTIPTPDRKFQGLFSVYGGDFQVRTRVRASSHNSGSVGLYFGKAVLLR